MTEPFGRWMPARTEKREEPIPPGTLTGNVIVNCITWLNQLDYRERMAAVAFLESWFK